LNSHILKLKNRMVYTIADMDLMSINITSNIYPSFSEFADKQIKNSVYQDMALSYATAPYLPDTRYELLAWFLCDQYPHNLTSELINNLESLWFKITSQTFSHYKNSDVDLLAVIQNFQYREHGLIIIYNDSKPVSRDEMMQLHTRFYDEFDCRISDFLTNDSFKHMIDSILAERLV